MAFLKEGNLRRSLDTYYLYTNRNEAIQRLMTLIDKNLGFSLFQSIEKAKINLSDAAKSEIHFHHYNIEIDELLVLDELNRFIQPDIQKIETFILNFMKSLSISTGEINNIFLTGGTSSLSAVRSIFERIFSKEKLREGDNFNSVAQGLALSYNFLKT
jgi:hypothetical chaperone protein